MICTALYDRVRILNTILLTDSLQLSDLWCAKIIFIGHTSDVHTWEQDKLTGCLFGCVVKERSIKKWVLVCSQVPDTLRDHSQASIECAKKKFIGHTSDVHTWEQDKLTGCLFGSVVKERSIKNGCWFALGT